MDARLSSCSIIIPVHNRASLTRQCLNALLAQFSGPDRPDIIVADDASTDLTTHVLSGYGDQIRVLRRAAQGGFAACCNDGAAQASGEYLVFLNNDTLPQTGWLTSLVGYANQHPQAAAVGSLLLFINGTVQHAGVVIGADSLPRHIYAGFPGDHPAVNKSRAFQIVTGACMLVRRDAFIELGGFDSRFLNSYEDVDFCLRLGERGHEVHFCHQSVLYHLESASRARAAEPDARNEALYLERWRGRVRQDDYHYYFADELIRIDHDSQYPVRVTISPYLAVLDRVERQPKLEQLLNERSRQVIELIRENRKLLIDLQHASGRVIQPRAGKGSSAPAPAPASTPISRTLLETPPQLLAQGKRRHLSKTPGARLVSILLPVKNGASQLRRLLPRLLSQQAHETIEIIAVDSGSSDDTVQVLEEHSATVASIPPQAFNHGQTRQAAASLAQGSLLVFINQSALPANRQWLANLIRPLDANPELAGVCSRIVPHPSADLLDYRDVMLLSPNSTMEAVTRGITDRREYRELASHDLRLFINFHSVSMATHARVLQEIPLRAVDGIGEDLTWAKEVLGAGYQLQLEPSSVVFHSHQYSLAEIFQRNMDDGMAARKIVNRQFRDADILPTLLNIARQDWQFIEAEPDLAPEERSQYKMQAFLRRSMQLLGQWIGTNYDRFQGEPMLRWSLVEQIMSGRSVRAYQPKPASARMPPLTLIQRALGEDADPSEFENSGRRAVQEIAAGLGLSAQPLSEFREILDFGCGCGRILRRLRVNAPDAHLSGVDVDSEAIRWLNTHMPDIEARTNAHQPPLPFADCQFDLVLCLEVFTHLDRTAQNAWLTEIHRVAAPGAWVLVSWNLGDYMQAQWPGRFKVERVLEGALNPRSDLVFMRRA